MARVPLYNRLPEIWRLLDSQGVLEGFLNVVDSELDVTHDQIVSLLRIHSVDAIPDKYLSLLAPFVGHIYDSTKSKAWNRARIRFSIARWSYKGTLTQLSDIIKENGGDWFETADNASRLMVLGNQAKLSSGNCHLMAADYWHDGAFVLRVDSSIDLPGLIRDLEQFKGAGEIWWFELYHRLNITYEQVWSLGALTVHPVTNKFIGKLGYGRLGIDLYLSFEGERLKAPQGMFQVLWHPSSNIGQDKLGQGLLGLDFPLSFDSSLPVEHRYGPVGWHRGNSEPSGLGVNCKFGVNFFLSYEPAYRAPVQGVAAVITEHVVTVANAIAAGPYTMDSTQTIDNLDILMSFDQWTPIPDDLLYSQLVPNKQSLYEES